MLRCWDLWLLPLTSDFWPGVGSVRARVTAGGGAQRDRQWWQWRWQLWELTIYEGPLPEASLPGLAGNP